MHETITLQFGQQANYLGTHYWNAQESYFTYAGEEESPVDHDISFRAGIGADGNDTYTPRTLIYDLKGAFGTLRRENALYQLQQQESGPQPGQWSGATVPLQLSPIAPSSYQQALEQGTEPPPLTTDAVRFWSDYNHLFYHPKSIVQLNEYELNSSLMPFERWQTGEELFANLDREHDLLDRDLRPFLEECDQLQALQVFTSIDDAWGGFAARYLERIADELGKGCRWVFGLANGEHVSRDRAALQLQNAARSMYAFDATASVHAPMTSRPASTPAYLNLHAASPWHSAALQAVLVETLTLPTRLRRSEPSRASFAQLETTLNNEGSRRLAMAGLSVDDPSHLEDEQQSRASKDNRTTNGHTHGQDNNNEAPETDISMFPDVSRSAASDGRRLSRRPHVFSAVESLRGPWKSAAELENDDDRDPFAGGPRLSSRQSQLLYPLLPSYPHILRFAARPEKVAVRASLSASTAVADQIRRLEGMSRRVVGVEEREALCDGLASMAEEYEEGWDGSDGSDDEG